MKLPGLNVPEINIEVTNWLKEDFLITVIVLQFNNHNYSILKFIDYLVLEYKFSNILKNIHCIKELNFHLFLQVTGKWFQYGVLFIVMLLDLNMWKNQILYDPLTYGQYTNAEGKVGLPFVKARELHSQFRSSGIKG